jgi:regulator of protease activity HflC (stomatin/prohibitin superfamily)
MGWFITALALTGLGIMLQIAIPTVNLERDGGYDQRGYRTKKTESVNTRWVGLSVLAIGLVILGWNSFHVVPTRNIAVETSAGRPVASLHNGAHLVRPWSDIHTYDATVQTLKLSGDNDDNGDPITVRLANGATADVDLTVQWQIDPKADITQLHMDYRDFQNIGNNVVRRQLSAAANEAMEHYDPLVALRNNKGDASGKTLKDLADDVKASLVSQMPTGITIRSVLMPKIAFSGEVQNKINQYLAALAETQIAEQRQKTAEAQKKANDLLAAGTSTNQAVLYQNCLDMVERLSRDSKPLPAAFSCGTPPQVTVPVGASAK